MIQLKTVVPGQFAVTAQPGPDDIPAIAEQGYQTIINNRPDSEAPGQPSAADVSAVAQEYGIHYMHIPVTAPAISRGDVDAFKEAVQEAPTPVVAHCGSGKRSFLLWAAGEAIHGGRSVDELVRQGERIGLDIRELPQLIERIG